MALVLAAGFALGQPVSPASEFDLVAKPHRFGRNARVYFVATPNGLTLAMIGDSNNVLLVSADPDGRILHSKSDLASVHAQIYAALPRPDGSVWLLSSSPDRMLDPFGVETGFGVADASPRPPEGRGSSTGPNFNQLDLYSPAGDHLAFLRLLAFAAIPVAAGNNRLILRSTSPPGFKTPDTIYFGTVVDNQFKETSQVRLEPPVTGAIPILASNGDLLLIDRDSGNMVVIDPNTKAGSVAHLAEPHRIQAAASDSGFLYLLSANSVLKVALTGQILLTYRPQLRRDFDPTSLGVSGNMLYLADKSAHVIRLHL